jgi:DNA-directed RNA polymerase II subunit RPB1
METHPFVTTDNIVGVQFGIFSPEEIRKRSVCEVKDYTTYDGNDPKFGGLFDPRMGVLDNEQICPTDNLSNQDCPGYFGHYELSRPVYYYQYLKQVMKTLRCVCISCGKLLVDKENPNVKALLKKTPKNRFKDIYAMSSYNKIKRCGAENPDGCGFPQPKSYKQNGLCNIVAEFKDMNNWSLTTDYVHKLLQRISDEDCIYMGYNPKFTRPDSMICTVLPIAPPTIRPSVKHSNNQRSEDDITYKFIDIIRTDKTIRSKIEKNSPQEIIDEWTTVLQYHVATLVDNKIKGIAPSAHRLGRPLKSINERLGGKEGIIRNNLSGKRVDFSARSVITPDPNLSIEELGVPYRVAKNLTYPEKVTVYNIDRLTKMVRNGPEEYPGAKSVFHTKRNITRNLKFSNRSSLKLELGDVVYRHLIDGDVVLFNRQPSLHRMSMLAHRIRVLEYNTFRMNVTDTTPYNADFDGDEMNMQVPQTIEASEELRNIVAIKNHIISPRTHSPIIKLVQDTLVGAYRMTKPNVHIPRETAMRLLMGAKNFLSELPTIGNGQNGKFTGSDIMTIITPFIHIMKGNNTYKDIGNDDKNSEHYVKIRRGIVEQGVFDKGILNSGSSGIIHAIANDYPKKVISNYLDVIQKVIVQFLMYHGFSIGVSDLVADEQTKKEIDNIINDKVHSAEELIQQLHNGLFENETGRSNKMHFEDQMNKILNSALKEAGKKGRMSLDRTGDNRMLSMVKSGSKGNSHNVSQIVSCIGQVNVEGQRITNDFPGRTLPHFTKYDDGPKARGFVKSSFMSGLDPVEFFFQAMAGRDGLIDTAVKTAETGYLQRRLSKSLEDLQVAFDYTVRSANGNIVQFLYGEDGIDGMRVENQYLPTLTMKTHEIMEKYGYPKRESWRSYLVPNVASAVQKKTKKLKNRLYKHVEQLIRDRDYMIENYFNYTEPESVRYSVPFQRIIQTIRDRFNLTKTTMSDLSPEDVLNAIDTLSKRCKIYSHSQNTKIFDILLRGFLSPRIITREMRFNKVAFNYLTEKIYESFYHSLVNPGEMVGTIAAQSIGEPTTQLTLNTFHLAGVGEKSNVTRGLPRVKEIIHASKNLKNPSLTIPLLREYRSSQEDAEKIANNIGLTILQDVVSKIQIYFDPNENNSIIEEDRDIIKQYRDFEIMFNGEENIQQESMENPWVLRIIFDRTEILERNITMEEIYFATRELLSHDLCDIIYTDTNHKQLMMRIRPLKNLKNGDAQDNIAFLQKMENDILNNVVIKGIPGIQNATIRKVKDYYEKVQNEFEIVEEWVIDTMGTNLMKILANPYVDSNRVLSNDILETMDVLGIDAARNLIVREFNEAISSGGGEYVNLRHIMLLADKMTTRGKIMTIDRHGVNKTDIGPMAKASFEETQDVLINAAIFGELDLLKGVSANIMIGQAFRGGTNLSSVILDEQEFVRLVGENDVTFEVNEVEKKETENEICIAENLFQDNECNVAPTDDAGIDDDDDFEIDIE